MQRSVLPDALANATCPWAASVSLSLAAVVLTAALPLIPWLLARWMGWARSWAPRPTVELGCSGRLLAVAAAATASVALTISIADARGLAWPPSWDTDRTCTYHVMFCEPTQASHLVRHVGNAYSNVAYLFAGLTVLGSQRTHHSPLYIPDVCFGLALLALAVASFLWHASNAPKVHYVDLAVMETVISYLQLRYACLAIHRSFRLSVSTEAWLCTALFTAIVAYQTELSAHRWQAGSMENGFPTGRSRLAGEGGLPLFEVCLFIATPILYYLVPCMAMLASGSVGSLRLATVSIASLITGWEVHLLERWALDGLCIPDAGVLGAVSSPTAIFHALTGVTLLTAYFHVRSLELVKS
uniref:Uncharacterized protein n=1 Tax=Pyrodinium bahamense TaxID=73915 RepID=A0A7S0FCB9_9DINO